MIAIFIKIKSFNTWWRLNNSCTLLTLLLSFYVLGNYQRTIIKDLEILSKDIPKNHYFLCIEMKGFLEFRKLHVYFRLINLQLRILLWYFSDRLKSFFPIIDEMIILKGWNKYFFGGIGWELIKELQFKCYDDFVL